MENEELIESVKRGDKKAFDLLVQKYHSELYYTAMGIVKSGWDSWDICQETFLKAYASIKSLKDPLKFRAWINRILMNKCYDHFRKTRKVIITDFADTEAFLEDVTEENLDLLKGLSSVKEEFRIVLTLRYFQDMPIKEIAEVLNCPEGTVKSRLSYALKEMRKIMSEDRTLEVGP